MAFLRLLHAGSVGVRPFSTMTTTTTTTTTATALTTLICARRPMLMTPLPTARRLAQRRHASSGSGGGGGGGGDDNSSTTATDHAAASPRCVLDDLHARGLVHQTTNEPALRRWLAAGERATTTTSAAATSAATTSAATPSPSPSPLPSSAAQSRSAPTTVYVGFDPTAPSLHLGSLLLLVTLRRFHRAGHRVVVLVGGATAQIGDPTGRRDDRPLLPVAQVEENKRKIADTIRFVFRDADADDADADADANRRASSSLPPGVMLLDNSEFYERLNVIEFMRTVGRAVRTSSLLSRDFVRSRLGLDDSRAGTSSSSSSSSAPADAAGISFAEFSYSLFQSYDFCHLADTLNCRLQIGGSDQYGNIAAGLEMYARLRAQHDAEHADVAGDEQDDGRRRRALFGLTTPLLLNERGEKMGKTAGGATVWLHGDLMSPFAFYQALVQQSDADALRMLRMLTSLDVATIDRLRDEHAPESRVVQHTLAHELCTLVHGRRAADDARTRARVLFDHSGSGAAAARDDNGQRNRQRNDAGDDAGAQSHAAATAARVRALFSSLSLGGVLAQTSATAAATATTTTAVPATTTTASTPSAATLLTPDALFVATPLEQLSVAELLVAARLASSKQEAKRLVKSSAVAVHGARGERRGVLTLDDAAADLVPLDAPASAASADAYAALLLRKGKKQFCLVIVRDERGDAQ